MVRERINIMLDKSTILKLDQLVKEGKKIYGNKGISRSKIIEDSVNKIEPPDIRIRLLMKQKQQEIMQLKDQLEIIERKKK